MKIKGTISADVVGFRIVSNNANDGREANVDLDIGFKQDEAAKKIGDDFVALAFSTMRVQAGGEGEDGYRHLVDSIKPGKNVVMERHRIVIDETEIETQPELLRVTPVDGEAKVVARIRLPIDVNKAAVINALVKSVGQAVKVKFSPQQGSFTFGDANGDADHGDAEDGAAAHQ